MKKGKSLLIVIAGAMWGTMGIFVRYFSALGFTSMQTVLLRALSTALFCVIGLAIYDRKQLKVRLKDIWCFVGTGILSVTFFNWCSFSAMTLTTLAVSTTLMYTAPVMVVLMSCLFFKEKLTGKKLIATALAVFGCVLVTGVLTGNTGAVPALGILFGLGSGFGYALYTIFGQFALNRGYSALTITTYTFVMAAVACTGICLFTDGVEPLLALTGEGLLWTAGLAVITTVFPYILYTVGLSGTEPGHAAVIACVEPVTAAVIGIILYGENLTAYTAAGIAAIIGALAILNIRFRKKAVDKLG